jgi:GT2 family glycosyltransferase
VTGLFSFFNAGQRIDAWLGGHFMRRRTYGGDSYPERADHVGAACLVVDRNVFLASSGFDERMWLFFSDADWALRMRRRGLSSVMTTDVSVVHEGGGSVGHLSHRRMATFFQRDYLRYASIHYGLAGRLVTRIGAIVLVGVLPALAALARGDLGEARASLAQTREELR